MAAPKENSPRPLVLVLPGDASIDGAGEAVREDLLEALQFLRLRTVTADAPESAARQFADHQGPALVIFDDVPGLPMDAVEGAVEALEEAPVVIGPCTDGSVYLLALGEGVPAEIGRQLIAAGSRSFEELVALMENRGLEGVALPPWFRLRAAKDVSFARTLARLSKLSDEGDMDFLADRLKLWLSQGTNE